MTIDNARFLPVVLPHVHIGHVLSLAHDHLGHNGISCTYALVRRLYFWRGMKSSITKYIKNCNICQKRNLQIVPYDKLHFDAATFPMEFISMDLIGEFYPPSKSGHKYALTVICILTGYVFCIPLKTKQASEVVQAYIDNVYAKFGGSLKILSDNGTEFKNQLFEQVANELGVKYKNYTTPYRPSSNGPIEGFHNFLKACIFKHISPQLKWTSVVPLACAAYNFLPNKHSKESPFFLMFGRDSVLPLNKLLSPQFQYLGNDLNMLSLEALKNMFHLAAENLHKARSHCDPSVPKHLPHYFYVGDTVLIKNHTATAFDDRYVGDFRIVCFKVNQVELIPSTEGKSKMEHISNIKYIMPAECYISQIPDYETFGRQTKLCLNPCNIPNLSWKWAETVHTQDVDRVTTSQIFNVNVQSAEKIEQVVKTSLRYENLESIYVNSHMYTIPSEAICTMTNSCEMVVSNCVNTFPLDICHKAI